MPDDVGHAAAPQLVRQGPALPAPATSILDPRGVLPILSAEHSSLLSTRSLAYNEAFTRAAMFLTFLSMSFVAVALVAQAIPIDPRLPARSGHRARVRPCRRPHDVTGRIIGTNYEDYRAVYGMARIRHGYGEIAPVVSSVLHDRHARRHGGCHRELRDSLEPGAGARSRTSSRPPPA